MPLLPVAIRLNPVVLTFNLKTTRLNVIATIFHVAATTFHLMTTGFDVAATTFHLMTTGFDVTATTFHRTATGLANFSRILFLIIPDLINIKKIILFVEMKIASWGGINGFSCKLSFQNLMIIVFMMRFQKPHKHSCLAVMDRLRTLYIGIIL